MHSGFKRIGAIILGIILLCAIGAYPQRYMENLGRGLVAIKKGSGYFLSWRLFGLDPAGIGFNVYKGTAKLNPTPITDATDYTDNTGGSGDYTVKPVVNGVEQAASKPAMVLNNPYLSIPMQPPFDHAPNKATVADLDGDGEYEIIVKCEQSPVDVGKSGVSGEMRVDAYKLNGTFMWRIKMGKNIREGSHLEWICAYDLDGDGKAEVMLKTADGTTDGKGKVIGDANADYRTSDGTGNITTGPEYITVFDGMTGAALATADFSPARGDISTWGDDKGNRGNRFLGTIAYVDGVRPSAVFCRGYYARTAMTAWNWRGGKLTKAWTFDTYNNAALKSYEDEGNHSTMVGDVDGDGKDEIVYGSCTIDHDGTGLYALNLGHGDAGYLGDIDPDRPGLEYFGVHEERNEGRHMHDAKTGAIIWHITATGDNGRGMAADIDPRHKGYEMWDALGKTIYDVTGKSITSAYPPCNMAAWWDDDLLRELIDENASLVKWNYLTSSTSSLLNADSYGCTGASSNLNKPALIADIFGDWREEIVYRKSDNSAMLIFSTTIPTTNRLYTLMQDPQYRDQVSGQNIAYQMSSMPSFYLGEGMAPPPRPNIITDGNTPIQLKPNASHRPMATLMYKTVATVLGDHWFICPASMAGKSKVVTIYDQSGRLVKRNIVDHDVINLQKDFGIAKKMYIVKVSAFEKEPSIY
jgi:rhamnogalacturonan endolyase